MRVRMAAVADGTSQSLLHATAAATRRSAVISSAVVYPSHSPRSKSPPSIPMKKPAAVALGVETLRGAQRGRQGVCKLGVLQRRPAEISRPKVVRPADQF